MQIQFQPQKIYLDNCCLGRSSDNQTQNRIRLETNAVETIINYIFKGELYWIVSEVLFLEVSKNPNVAQRDEINDLLNFAHHTVSVEAAERSRGRQLEAFGFKPLDALHIACAETGGVDIFLTTDDKILNRATRFSSDLCVRVENPHTWLQDMI